MSFMSPALTGRFFTPNATWEVVLFTYSEAFKISPFFLQKFDHFTFILALILLLISFYYSNKNPIEKLDFRSKIQNFDRKSRISIEILIFRSAIHNAYPKLAISIAIQGAKLDIQTLFMHFLVF